MTEEEWLTTNDPEAMVKAVKTHGVVTNRKSRLFGCGCYRIVWDFIGCPVVREAVAKAEERADGRVSQRELMKYQRPEKIAMPGTPDFGLQANLPSLLAAKCNAASFTVHLRYAFGFFRHSASPLIPDLGSSQASLVREIFGNPFRPVTFSPEWRTDTAVSLARTMYEARDFSAMPILADALQDAGCDNEAILAHCRDPKQVHVRGCWVVDLVLGKS